MRRTPHYLLEAVPTIKQLVRDNPWATIVASTQSGLVASHYPVLIDEADGEGITLLGHVGRPDDELLGLGDGEVMVIIQGPHGYISPSWYPEGQFVPTWNHVTAHLWGTPEILDPDANFAVLGRLVDEFEQQLPNPRSLELDVEAARHVATGTTGFRLKVDRFDARAKLSQNKPAEVRRNIIDHLRTDETFGNPRLAATMEAFLERD